MSLFNDVTSIYDRGVSKMTINLHLHVGYTEQQISDLTPVDWAYYTFNGDYLKIFYDVEYQGKVYLHCYPNGGTFTLRDGKNSEFIPVKNITKFRVAAPIKFKQPPVKR